MTIIRITATDQNLTVLQEPVIASGDIDTTCVEFIVSNNWDVFAMSATFYTSLNSTVYEIPLIDNRCTVPHEVLENACTLFIGLRGVKAGGLTKTSSIIKYKIIEGAPHGTGTSKEPTTDVYQQMMSMTAEAAASSAKAVASSAAAEASSAKAVAESTEAKAIAQSVRDDADNGLFKGDRGERGAKGDTGRGYDGSKIVKKIASGTTSRKTPVSVVIPNALECEEIYISVYGGRRSSTAICYGAWNGKTVFRGNYWSDDIEGDSAPFYGPDLSDIITLLESSNENHSYTDICLKLCINGVLFSSNGGSLYAKEVAGAGTAEDHYITIVPVMSWYSGYSDNDVTYSVYVVDRESSGEGDTAPEELVHEGIEAYLAENGLSAQAVVDADVLQAALWEVLK